MLFTSLLQTGRTRCADTMDVGVVFESLEERRLLSASPIDYELEAVLHATDPAEFAGFGGAIATKDDLLAVGVPGADRVDLIDLATGSRIEIQGLAGVSFGIAVDFVGDFLVIGAREELVDSSMVGRVHVYDLNGDFQHSLESPTNAPFGNFGSNVVAYGDQHVLITAMMKDGFGSGGSVYLYDINGGSPLREFINPIVAFGSDGFGDAVAVSGNRVLIGARFADDDGFFSSGAAFLYDGETAGLIRQINDPNPGFFNDFGLAVGFAGNDLIVGSWGVLYLLDGDDDSVVHTFDNLFFSGSDNLAVNDAQDTVLIGTAGSAHLLDIATGELLFSFVPDEVGEWDLLIGAHAGDRVILGSPSTSSTWLFDGLVLVYAPVTDGGEDPGDPGDPTDPTDPEPQVPSAGIADGNLIVTADAAGSSIAISMSGGGVAVQIDGVDFGVYFLDSADIVDGSPVGYLVIRGGDGSNEILLAGNVSVPAVIYGGEGNDTIRGGASNDILLGGGGDDLIIGHRGRNILIGGEGSDRIIGHASDDILIAGYTDHDNNLQALIAIQAEWLSGRSYLERISNLKGEQDGNALFDQRANGDFFLQPNITVHHGGGQNMLTGGAGEDWFIISFSEDKVTDLKKWEYFDDLDYLVDYDPDA